MDAPNPFAPPRAPLADAAPSGVGTDRLNRIASDQRLIIWSLLLSLAVIGLQAAFGGQIGVLNLGVALVTLVGVVRLGGALGLSTMRRLLCALAMLLPLINYAVMLVLSQKATTVLRAAGYRVGLLGARAR